MADHWYDPKTGEPRHFVECKTREGTRPSTLSDARKHGWVPSVTTVLKAIAKPGLEKWLIAQAVHAVTTAPDVAGEGLDAKIERVLERERQQDEESKRARDLGTSIHEAIEERLAGRLIAPQFEQFVGPVLEQLPQLGRVIASERILVSRLGFAGKTDCLLENGAVTVLDFKSAKVLPKKEAWPEHRLQVSAYASCLGNTGNKPIHTALLYISTVEPGKTALFVQTEWQEAFQVFQAVFRTWCWLNSYTPSCVGP